MSTHKSFKPPVPIEFYQVGDIYITTNDKHPSKLLGYGEWERIQGKFLLAAGGGYTAGATGGQATVTLTVDEIPSHTHSTYYKTETASGSNKRAPSGSSGTELETGTKAAGGGKAHNNMPPYLVVNVWKRTA